MHAFKIWPILMENIKIGHAHFDAILPIYMKQSITISN